MKTLFQFLVAVLVVTNTISCVKDTCTETRKFTQFLPVYMSEAQIRKDITFESAKVLENPGKMYFYNDYLFINELGQGVHIYKMTDLTAPQKIGFYEIPGNFDIAIRNNTLYADNAMDVVALDLTEVTQPRLIKREKNVLNQFNNFNNMYYVYSRKSDVVQEVSCSNPNINNPWFFEGDVLFDSGAFNNTSVTNANASTGVAGSFARFSIVNNYLYVVDQSSLKTFNIQDSNTFTEIDKTNIGWGIETIFPYQNNLFIGSNNGMFIYSLTTPSKPSLLSVFEHARACDPVVVENNIAYVTLRNGSQCQGFVNQLDVIDVSNLLNPKLIKTYPMEHPHGLSVREGFIYLAEGLHGFKILDGKDSNQIKEINFTKGPHAYDMISLNPNTLFLVGDDGFYTYDVTDKTNPKVIGSIKKGI